MEFHEKLKNLRLNLGKTQKEMAYIFKTDERSYRRYEKGEQTPGGDKFMALKSNYPSVDLNYLLDPNK